MRCAISLESNLLPTNSERMVISSTSVLQYHYKTAWE
jgi:hypothetical protein